MYHSKVFAVDDRIIELIQQTKSAKILDLIEEVEIMVGISKSDAAQAVIVVLGYLEKELPASVLDDFFEVFG